MDHRLIQLPGLVLVAVAVTGLAAGQAPAGPADAPLSYAKEMQPFAPWMVGEWNVVGKFEPSVLFPKGGPESGKLIGRVGPNGASMVFDYEGKGPAGILKGQGSITYDPAKSQYLMSWCDATGCGPVGVGEWDYDYVIFKGERVMAGHKIPLQWMFGNIATGTYSVNVALTDDNGSMVPVGIVTYTRPDAPKSRQPIADGQSRVAPSVLLGALKDVRGVRAPEFELRDLANNKVRLSDFRGSVVLLNFWATWCEPCRKEVPLLVELQNKYGQEGLQIVGIDMDEGAVNRVLTFVRDQKLNYPVLRADLPTAEAYGTTSWVPITFLIDGSGRVASRFLGTVERADLEATIKNALEAERNVSAIVI